MKVALVAFWGLSLAAAKLFSESFFSSTTNPARLLSPSFLPRPYRGLIMDFHLGHTVTLVFFLVCLE